MSRLKQPFLFLLFALAFSHSAFAGDSLLYKHRITTNIFIDLMEVPNIAYEYRLSNRIGIESSIGLAVAKAPGSSIAEIAVGPDQGEIFRLNPKFYFLSEPGRAVSFYLAPMYQYKHLTYHDLEDKAEEGLYSSGIYTEKRKVNGASLLVGSNLSYRHFLVDIFTGFGYKSIQVTSQYSVYHYDMYSPDACPCQVSKHEENAIAFHLAVKIGYQFGPIIRRHI